MLRYDLVDLPLGPMPCLSSRLFIFLLANERALHAIEVECVDSNSCSELGV